MSDSIRHRSGGNETPNEGVRGDREKSPINADIASAGSEDGEVRDDTPVGTKRHRSPSSETQSPRKRTKPATEPGVGSFRTKRNPVGRMPCVISVDNGDPIGSLYAANDGFAIMLFIDSGRYGPPTISLGFRNNGTKPGPDFASSRWDTGTNIRERWAIDGLRHGHATPDATDPRMSNPGVLARCGPQDTGELLYVRFDSHNETMGFYNNKVSFKGQNRGIQKSLQTIFRPRKSYSLELWFIPSFQATEFRKNCLSFFSDSIEQRVHNLEFWRDSHGDYFKNELRETAPRVLATNPYAKPMLRGRGRPPGATAEQSNALEYGTAVAEDAEVPHRSPASSIERPPKTEETQAMLTVEAGPVSPPVHEQQTSASGSSIAHSSVLRSPQGYMPSFMLGDSDGSNIDLDLDSGDE